MNAEWRTQNAERRGTAWLVALAAAAATITVFAHKPITSNYTYNEHVFPIVRDRCGRCHVEGGIAPMSLMTYRDAYPWAESIRAELVAGHMPPWSADAGDAPFQHARTLSAHEIDVLVTWATGGTPEGRGPKPTPVALTNTWVLGEPDLTLTTPDAMTLPAGEMETTRELVLPGDGVRDRPIRAIDLLPETPAVVRRAVFVSRSAKGDAGAHDEQVIAVWLPGGDTIPAPDHTGFVVPRDGDLVARITYRKTWKYENTPMTDRSRIGVYFAADNARAIESLRVDGGTPIMLDRDVDLLAIRIEASRPDQPIELFATRGDGSSAPLLRGMTQPDWPRRYWYERPIQLPRSVRLSLSAHDAARPAVVGLLDVIARP